MDTLAAGLFEVGLFEGWEAGDFLLLFGGILGLMYGMLAQGSNFCFRAAVAETGAVRRPRTAQWIAATGVAIAATQAGIALGYIDVSETPMLRPDFSLGGLIVGGLLFGVGMSFAGGCISRLTILAVRGNLRSVFSLMIVMIVGYAAIRGLLAPARAAFSDGTRVAFADVPPTLTEGLGSLTGLSFEAIAIAMVILSLVVGLPLAWKIGGKNLGMLTSGAGVGLLIAAGFAVTTWAAAEAFDPIAVESLRFTQPSADALMFSMISTGVTANFGIVLFGGVLAGGFLQAAAAGSLRLEGFSDPAQMARSGLGAAAMGVGGVLALGCAVGQGLSGVSTLAVPSILALISIYAGARIGQAWRAQLEGGAERSAGIIGSPAMSRD
jgi:hypothetical protein